MAYMIYMATNTTFYPVYALPTFCFTTFAFVILCHVFYMRFLLSLTGHKLLSFTLRLELQEQSISGLL